MNGRPMTAAITTLLAKPGTFFERRADDVSVTGPLLTVAAVSLVGVVGAIAALAVQYVRLPGTIGTFLLVGGVFAVLVRAVVPVVVWLVYSGVFLAITALFDGEGEPRVTILLAGWGMAPRVVGVAVVSAGAIAANLLTPVPTGAESVQAYSQQLQQHPANLAVPLVQLLTFFWSGAIWIHAVERARNVTRWQAAIAVGVPLAIEVLVTLGLLALALVAAA